MGNLNKLLGYIQAAEAANITGGALGKPFPWPEEERLALEYYEPAARQLCWMQQMDPEQRCEFVGEGSVVETADKVLYYVPRWQTVVARLKEFDIHWLALGSTVEVRAEILAKRMAATNSAEAAPAEEEARAH